MASIFQEIRVSTTGVYPHATDCPLCRAKGRLEIRSHDNIHCRSCKFTGDVIALYAKVGHMDVSSGVYDLVLRGVLDWSSSYAEEYLRVLTLQAPVHNLWARAAARMADPSSTVLGVCEEWGVPCTRHSLAASYGYNCVIVPDDLDDWPPIDPIAMNRLSRWLGKYSAIGIPCWVESRVVGFWLLRPTRSSEDGVASCLWAPTEAQGSASSTNAVGYAQLLRCGSRKVIVVDDPLTAFRLNTRQFIDGDHQIPVVCPVSLSRMSGLDSCKLVFLPQSQPAQMLGYAMGRPNTQAINPHTCPITADRPLPDQVNLYAFLEHDIIGQALPAAKAVADYLLGLPTSQLSTVISSMSLSDEERQTVIAASTGQDRAVLERLLAPVGEERSVKIGKKLVIDADDGWYCDNDRICDARVMLDRVVVDKTAGKRTIYGSIWFHGHLYEFQAPLDVLGARFDRWLRDFLLEAASRLVFIAQGWGNKLASIAQALHAPSVVASDTAGGWSQQVLTLPSLVVSKTGVISQISNAVGAEITEDDYVPPDIVEVCLSDPGFAEFSLILLGNLWLTANGRPGRSIVGRDCGYLVSGLAQQLKLRESKEYDPDVVQHQQYNPFPTCVSWQENHVAGLTRNDTHNVFVSTDIATFTGLRTRPGWLRLGNDTVEHADKLTWVVWGVADLLKAQGTPDDSLYEWIFERLDRWVGSSVGKGVMLDQARALDRRRYTTHANLSSQLLYLLVEMCESNILPVQNTARGPEVAIEHIMRAVNQGNVRNYSQSFILDLLTDKKLIVRKTQSTLVFGPDLWSLASAFVR